MTFIIFSLPRSRSAWLSHFLSYGNSTVGHDLAPECSSIEEFLDQLEQIKGTCETGAIIGWRLVKKLAPGIKMLTVFRPLEEVQQSLANLGVFAPAGDLESKAVMLEKLAEQPEVPNIYWKQLDDPVVAKAVFEWALEIPFDFAWWQHCQKLNIQVDVMAELERQRQNAGRIAGFKQQVLEMGRQLQCWN